MYLVDDEKNDIIFHILITHIYGGIMKNFILAPDSFKGTMSADTVSKVWKKAILSHIPDAKILEFPLADGGEGMVDAYLRVIGGKKKEVNVTGPMGEKVDAAYGILPDGTAVLEMAACAGLPLVKTAKNPLLATTYGVGEMIKDAAKTGAKEMILGLGGSATNDCGIGMAAALGFGFYDANGSKLEPLAKNMIKVHHIEAPTASVNINVTAACDVDNPLFGPNGATYTFGPQKGVSPELLSELDDGIKNIAHVIERDLGIKTADVPGSGAAGGLGCAVIAFLGGKLKPGIDLLLDAAHFDNALDDADVVFVGEGRMDWQSAHGKAPIGIARRAKAHKIPVYALCGSLGKDVEAVYNEGIIAAFAADQGATDMEHVAEVCEADMSLLADSVMRLLICKFQNP